MPAVVVVVIMVTSRSMVIIPMVVTVMMVRVRVVGNGKCIQEREVNVTLDLSGVTAIFAFISAGHAALPHFFVSLLSFLPGELASG